MAGLLMVAACTELGPEDVVGTFELQSIAGASVPAQDASGVTWLAASFDFEADGDCLFSGETTSGGSAVQGTFTSCTWSLEGDDVGVVFPTTGATGTGELSGRTLTFTFSADNARWPWVFSK